MNLRDLRRIEYVIPGIDCRVRPEDVARLFDVVADPGRAPHVVDRILIAGIVARQPVGDLGPRIDEVRQFRLVELLENACSDLAGEEITGRHHDVVAGFAGQQLCLQCIVGVEGVVADLYPGLFGEIVENRRVDIVRPVVEIDDAFLLRAGAGADTPRSNKPRQQRDNSRRASRLAGLWTRCAFTGTNRVSLRSAARLPSRPEFRRRGESCNRSLAPAPRARLSPSGDRSGRQTPLRFPAAPGSSPDRKTESGTRTAPGKRSTAVSLGSRTSTRTMWPSFKSLRDLLRRQIAHLVPAPRLIRHGPLLAKKPP